MPGYRSVASRILNAIAILFLTVVPCGSVLAQEPVKPPQYEVRKRQVNENVVTIISSGTASPYATMAEDIQNVVDEPKVPNGLRVLPILGRGGAHNALDVLLLKGVDMGVMEKDDVQAAKKDDPVVFANAEQRIQYIAKIANSEFQIIARSEIRTLKDLEGKKVNFLKKLSSTDLACQRIFDLLGIKVEPVYFDQESASAKLKSGEIAAFARYAPSPHNAFKGFRAADGFHFIPVDAETLPQGDYGKLLKIYSPALLANEIYPDLVPADKPVPAIGGSLLLVTYAWPMGTERYQRVSKFVTKFFDNIEKFKLPGRHPQWKSINLAYEVPGWIRFKPAQDWLNARKSVETTASANDTMRVAFDDFLRKQGVVDGTLSERQRDAMFAKFMEWWKAQKVSQP